LTKATNKVKRLHTVPVDSVYCLSQSVPEAIQS